MDPEKTHKLMEYSLRQPFVWRIYSKLNGPLESCIVANVAGIEFPSPIGASAGIDKNCRFLSGLLNLGFGFVVGGTVTLKPQAGNKRPRVLRYPESNSIVNSLGFPGEGIDKVISRLKVAPAHKSRLLISIAGTNEEEFVTLYKYVYPLCAAIEINISSPNTLALSVFREPNRLKNLIYALTEVGRLPILVKLPRWKEKREFLSTGLELIEGAASAGASGFVIANTLPVDNPNVAVGYGGLSGSPLLEGTAYMVSCVREALGKEYDIVACGGISSAQDVWRMLALGASAVQLYTAIIYHGVFLPRKINHDLARMMKSAGVKKISEISGLPPQL